LPLGDTAAIASDRLQCGVKYLFCIENCKITRQIVVSKKCTKQRLHHGWRAEISWQLIQRLFHDAYIFKNGKITGKSVDLQLQCACKILSHCDIITFRLGSSLLRSTFVFTRHFGAKTISSQSHFEDDSSPHIS
jgi:hypothetical protein